MVDAEQCFTQCSLDVCNLSRWVGDGREVAMAKKSKAHPGFKAVASKIAKKQGVSKAEASAMLAASTRKASKAAKKKNPRLKRVKG